MRASASPTTTGRANARERSFTRGSAPRPATRCAAPRQTLRARSPPLQHHAEDLLHPLQHRVDAETRVRPRPPRGPEPRAQRGVVAQPGEGRRKRGRVAWRHDEAGHSGVDRFADRFRTMEGLGELEGLSPEELDERWEHAKVVGEIPGRREGP